jgi:hypothetical protein
MTHGGFQIGDECRGRRVSGGGIWRPVGAAAPVGHYVVETDGATGERRVVCYLEPAWRTAEASIAAALRAALASADGSAPSIRIRWLAGAPAAREPVAAPAMRSAEEGGREGAAAAPRQVTTGVGSTMDMPAPSKKRGPLRISPYLPASGSVAMGALLLANYVYQLLAFVGIDTSGSTLWQTALAGFLCLIAGIVCVIAGSPVAYLGNAALLAAIGGLNLRQAGALGWDSLLPFAAALLHGVAALVTIRSSRAEGG